MSALVVLLTTHGVSWAQEAEAKEAAVNKDNFFAGTVTESTAVKLTVSRVVRGKAQKRSFKVNPDTKVDGKLRVKVRVTVQYVSDDEGDTAMRVVVRTASATTKP